MAIPLVLVGIAMAVLAPAVLGAFSYYRTGTLAQDVTYDSVQRNDWDSNSLTNSSGGSISARTWVYNVITNAYVYQDPFDTVPPGGITGKTYTSQTSTKNYCRKNSAFSTAGNCGGFY